MTRRRHAWTGLLLIVVLGACGSDSDADPTATSTATGTGTELEIQGVATAAVTPDQTATTPPVPGNGAEIDISGRLRCDDGEVDGTGIYAANATELCQQVVSRRAVFEEIAAADDAICAQVYGGPQHASIRGTIDGAPVDIDVTRADGCGIESWQRLEWLLGPPER